MSDPLKSTRNLGDPSASSFGISHPGRVRETNQDQFLIAQLNRSMLVSSSTISMDQRLYGGSQGEVLLVADGMGGHAAGEHASRLAIGHLINRLLNSVHCFFELADGDEKKEQAFIEDLQDSLRDAHERILRESARNADRRGMGTTLTMAYLAGPRMYVLHAGDSRCYLFRNGKAEQLTTDHTLARQMVESGGLRPEDEAHSKWSNVLWNVLGGKSKSDLIAEVRRVDLQEGDVILLCSDGLHRYVDDRRLAAIVSASSSAEVACERLVALANRLGGEDNITVVVSKSAGSVEESDENMSTTWIDDFDTIIPGSHDTLM